MAGQASVADRYRHLIGTEHVLTTLAAAGRPSMRQLALAIGDLNPLSVGCQKP
jgi:hypothetical protein